MLSLAMTIGYPLYSPSNFRDLNVFNCWVAQGYYCNILVGLGYFVLGFYMIYNKHCKNDQLEDLPEDLASSVVSRVITQIMRNM